MKFLSGLLGFTLLALALCFAVANRQDATVNLWPFGIEVTAPLCLMTIGTLGLGLLLGLIIGWFAGWPHRREARRLRKDIAALNDKIMDLQQSVLPPLDDQIERVRDHTKGLRRLWSGRR